MSELPTNDAEDAKQDSCPVRQELKRHMYHRSASLSDVEKTFLSSLLIDQPPTLEEEELHKKKIESANNVLTDDILFSIPFNEDISDGNERAEKKQSLPPKIKRSNPQLGKCFLFAVVSFGTHKIYLELNSLWYVVHTCCLMYRIVEGSPRRCIAIVVTSKVVM